MDRTELMKMNKQALITKIEECAYKVKDLKADMVRMESKMQVNLDKISEAANRSQERTKRLTKLVDRARHSIKTYMVVKYPGSFVDLPYYENQGPREASDMTEEELFLLFLMEELSNA